MKKYNYILLTLLVCFSACRKLDIPPKNIIQDPDVFSTPAGIQAYMARIYSELPIEDFRYSPQRGFKLLLDHQPNPCNHRRGIKPRSDKLDAGKLRRLELGHMGWLIYNHSRLRLLYSNIAIAYASNFSTAQVNAWLG